MKIGTSCTRDALDLKLEERMVLACDLDWNTSSKARLLNQSRVDSNESLTPEADVRCDWRRKI